MKSFLECSGRSKTGYRKDKQVDEDMVAGDSGGSPVDIAAGKTTGAVTSPGPETLGKKKKNA
ncbi:hypothetical protein OFDDKENP_00134 [Aeromonas phage B614]|nr:hypothetical protein OFDDKENP_00134 [Aeromonas phage B614]UYD58138.1 hypothetical protein JNEOFJEA_00041 [Aeromonas phage UP87]UYD58502.1 hypothetical protein IPAKJDPM_00159 [Aeromonas phage avDM14-QBC]UYD58718.1 hypothetical protein HNNIDBEH_00125 [Aeromonas phage avDM10-HWA]UYD58979.1 hypothetical protein OFOPOMKI_00129 [Aeromonas phage avDM7-IJDJ]UYD59791.1 hypothetical protein LEHPIFIF_00018 [Aeromonas phage avDM9-HANS]